MTIKRITVGIALGLFLLILAVSLFQWNWLRQPLGHWVTSKTGRVFTIQGDLKVSLGRVTRITAQQVHLGNPDWASTPAMLDAETVLLALDVPALFTGRVLLHQLDLDGASLALERNAQGQRNWVFGKAKDAGGGSAPEVQFLTVQRSHVAWRDAPLNAEIAVDVSTDNADITRPTRLAFSGKYHNQPVSGSAAAGPVLSLQDALRPFPMRVHAKVGSTAVELDGTVLNLARFSQIDAKLSLAGPSLATLYPVIPLALPSTPPYHFSGHFLRDGGMYSYKDFNGVIGRSDMRGEAVFSAHKPRPELTAMLTSHLLDLADLAPLVGTRSVTRASISTNRSTGPPNDLRARASPSSPASASASSPRNTASAASTSLPSTSVSSSSRSPDVLASNARKILPDAPFDMARMNALDADVTLDAEKIRRPDALPIENMHAHLRQKDGLLTLEPLSFGFSGGTVVASIKLDANQKPMAAQADIDLRQVRLQHLFPTVTLMRASFGLIGAQMKLTSSGNSVASLLGNANGKAAIAMEGGELSGLLLEAVDLNGLGILKYLALGDKVLPNRCSAADFDIKNGLASSRSLVLDTTVTTIIGHGSVDLRNEQIDLILDPKPKHRSILVARTPIRILGPFSHPDYQLVKGPLLARGGAAVALAVLNPFAALLALVETGPGKDVDCKALLGAVQGARQQATKSTDANRPAVKPVTSMVPR